MICRALSSFAVLTATLLAAPADAAGRSHERAPEGFVRWAGAAEEVTWQAGGEATLAWEPGPAFAATTAGRRVDEWEAFLSLDGGRTWPVRLTPHLSTRVRRLPVRLPAMEASEARLLLRFGDERSELEVELPLRIRIAAAGDGRGWLPTRRAWRSGEPARPGASGALFWAEGDRAAAAVEIHESEPFEARISASWRVARPALLPAGRSRDRGGDALPVARETHRVVSGRCSAGTGSAGASRRRLSPLRATCRLNL